MQIPTNPNFKSLNLSHSLIILSQLVASIIKIKNLPFKKSKKVKSASKKEIQSMVNLCIRNLDQKNFFKPKENIAGVKIKKQDTSPSYSFGESGIDPNEKYYKSAN